MKNRITVIDPYQVNGIIISKEEYSSLLKLASCVSVLRGLTQDGLKVADETSWLSAYDAKVSCKDICRLFGWDDFDTYNLAEMVSKTSGAMNKAEE